jgi:MtN3 and saliva related transmembrane protein
MSSSNPFAGIVVIKEKTMEQSILYTICGYVASIGLILGFLPQAITTIRTRNTDGISVPAFLMMAIGAFAFMLQGLLHRPNIIWSMLITNAVTGTCSCIIFIIKMYNDRKKQRTGI